MNLSLDHQIQNSRHESTITGRHARTQRMRGWACTRRYHDQFFRELGWINMELKLESPSRHHWSEADGDSHREFREWGYEEAETAGTRNYESL